MYWSPKRNHLLIVTWNFMKASKTKEKMWWEKWRLFWEGCCPTNGEASGQVLAEGSPLTKRNPFFPTHRAFFPELSRSFQPPGYLQNQERESCHRMVIKGNLSLSVKAKRNSEVRTTLLATPKYGFSWELVWNSESQLLPGSTESEFAPGDLPVQTFLIKVLNYIVFEVPPSPLHGLTVLFLLNRSHFLLNMHIYTYMAKCIYIKKLN